MTPNMETVSPDEEQATRSLIDERLVIVTGKGGTGKTTVAAALAHAAQRAGRRVLLTDTGFGDPLAALIVTQPPPIDYAGRELLPGLTVMRIDPHEALSEYLGLQIGLRPLLDPILGSQGFRQLMDAAPGWRELIILGKIWHLEQMRLEPDRPRYDLIIVDAPSTGHGLTFLDVPRVVASAVRSGPLRRNAAMVEAMIRDRDDTLLLPVTLAEELPVQETAELIQRARDHVGIRVGPVVVNAVAKTPLPPDLADLDQRLAALPEDSALGQLPEPGILARCTARMNARHRLHESYIDKIQQTHGETTLVLPRLSKGIRGPEDVAQLGRHLAGESQREVS